MSALHLLGGDINAQDVHLATPLHLAARNNNRAAVASLLGFPEIQVNPRDKLGCTPLDWSVAQAQPRIMSLLRQYGAKHSPDFAEKLNLRRPEARVESEYDPNLWAVATSDWRETYEQELKDRQAEIEKSSRDGKI
jgi:hypothetical protein